MDANVIAYADKAADRLGRKYRRMIRMGKPHNVAVTAIARELACYIWGIETGIGYVLNLNLIPGPLECDVISGSVEDKLRLPLSGYHTPAQYQVQIIQ